MVVALMTAGAELILAARPCSQCLTTKRRIVSGERAAEIVRGCKRDGTHFICHKARPGEIVHCRGVHNALGGSRAHAFAEHFGIPIIERDMDG